MAVQGPLETTRLTAEPEFTLVPALGLSLITSPDGTVALSAAEPLVCFRDLRVSMFAMTLGMAYMFAAMQLAM